MVERQRKLSWWEKIIEPMVASPLGGWYFINIAPHIDRLLIRWTKGRLSTALGQPVGLVTMRGAKSGLPRQVPLLCVPDGENYIVLASRAGDTRHPVWYYNLRANPEVTLLLNGRQGSYMAHETTGAEREGTWQKAVDFFVGYEAYQQRAGDRLIPVFLLRPT
jgi:deazaflavin-dependent oxidoreductase (nitroreductase family)